MSYLPGDWISVLEQCGVSVENASVWAPYCSTVLGDETFAGGQEELAQFLGQALHESQLLSSIAENLNYAASALISIFGTQRISAAQAEQYGRTADHPADQEKIANIIYGGPWGLKELGNKNPGDGWSYRGSGLIQVTGFYNFQIAEKDTDIPFTTNPDLMRTIGTPPIEASVFWWHRNVSSAMLANPVLLRKRVNTAGLGLQDCIELTNKARQALNSVPQNPTN